MTGKRARRPGTLAVAGLAAATGLAACSLGGGDPGSATGGLALELRLRGEGNLAALYRVEPDGTIGFGGGADARNRRTTWTGTMTPGEIAELRELLEKHGWFEGGPASTGDPPQRVCHIKLTWPQGRRHYKVKGASADVTAVYELLDRVARRRLDPVLEMLPKASTRPQEP